MLVQYRLVFVLFNLIYSYFFGILNFFLKMSIISIIYISHSIRFVFFNEAVVYSKREFIADIRRLSSQPPV